MKNFRASSCFSSDRPSGWASTINFGRRGSSRDIVPQWRVKEAPCKRFVASFSVVNVTISPSSSPFSSDLESEWIRLLDKGSHLAADLLHCSPRLQEVDIALDLTRRRLGGLKSSVDCLLAEIRSLNRVEEKQNQNQQQQQKQQDKTSTALIPSSLRTKAAPTSASGPAALGPVFARTAVNVAFAFLRQAWRQGGDAGGDPGEGLLADTLVMFQALPDACMFGATQLVWREVAEKFSTFLQQSLMRWELRKAMKFDASVISAYKKVERRKKGKKSKFWVGDF